MSGDETDFKFLKGSNTGGAESGGGSGGKGVTAVDGSVGLQIYNMNHKNRGICVLINQKFFDFAKTGQNTRDGTDVDADKAEGTFRKLGYEVRRFSNLRGQEIVTVLHNISREDHSDNDSFACIVLSHGIEGRIYGYDTTVSIENLTRPFRGDNCESLVGKPKLFFFQACRGSRFDHGVEADRTDALKGYGDNVVSTKLPIEADFLLAYSTVPGFFSWRNNQDGSWFIQSLCRALREHVPHGVELMHILITVNYLVATSYESCTDQEWTDGMKQMPSIVCMLTKQLYFGRRNR